MSSIDRIPLTSETNASKDRATSTNSWKSLESAMPRSSILKSPTAEKKPSERNYSSNQNLVHDGNNVIPKPSHANPSMEISQETPASSGLRNNNFNVSTHPNDIYPPSPYPSYGMGLLGGRLGGDGGFYSPLYYSGIGTSMMPGGGGIGTGVGLGALSNLNQFLFSVQTIIFSLGQAVQIIGMNTQALHQLYDQAVSMLDHGLQFLQELKTLDLKASKDVDALSLEEIKRRRRLKALRWGIVLSLTYAGYALVHKWMKRRSHRSGDWKRRARGLMNGHGSFNTLSYPPPTSGSGSWMHPPQPSYSFAPPHSPYSPVTGGPMLYPPPPYY